MLAFSEFETVAVAASTPAGVAIKATQTMPINPGILDREGAIDLFVSRI